MKGIRQLVDEVWAESYTRQRGPDKVKGWRAWAVKLWEDRITSWLAQVLGKVVRVLPTSFLDNGTDALPRVEMAQTRTSLGPGIPDQWTVRLLVAKHTDPDGRTTRDSLTFTTTEKEKALAFVDVLDAALVQAAARALQRAGHDPRDAVSVAHAFLGGMQTSYDVDEPRS